MLVYIIMFVLPQTLQFKIKHASKETYVCYKNISSKNVLTECPSVDTAIDWELEPQKGGGFLVNPKGEKDVWDTAEAWRIEVKVKHGKPNQNFQFAYFEPDQYTIVSREKCLTNEKDTFHYMRFCTNEPNQLYSIVFNDKEKEKLTVSKPPAPPKTSNEKTGGSGAGDGNQSSINSKPSGSSNPSGGNTSSGSSKPSGSNMSSGSSKSSGGGNKVSEDLKEIAKHIFHTHNKYHHIVNRHGHAFHRHGAEHRKRYDRKIGHKRRHEKGPFLLDYIRH